MNIATPDHFFTGQIVFEGIRWETYEALLEDLSWRRLRLTYDEGVLEIMSPRLDHERFKTLLGRMVEALTEELRIPMVSAGSTTWKRFVKKKGFESDESYYIQNERRMRGKIDFDPEVDPPPDLAIEVEITKSALDRLGIFAAFGVPEIWRYDGKRLRFAILQKNGEYKPSPTSRAFPFLRPAQIERHLAALKKTDETTWIRAFRKWVRETFGEKSEPRPRRARGRPRRRPE
ncbi:MAG: Uma2 family endonuclease [Planctomycetes bacterium]|nr:Uma2 family endonuclease [Planctomycetota bacterium]